MASSRQGGAFGFLKKSIGSVTYSTIKDGKGKRIQVARSKPTEVANPNTVAQILQRMKVKPAARFFKAFEEVLNNAFEGVAYGAASRRHFMGLAMSQTGPYIPKQATRFIPAKYTVAQGALPAGSLVYGLDADMGSQYYGSKGFIFSVGGDITAETGSIVDQISEKYGVCQLTFLVVKQDEDGSFVPMYGRIMSDNEDLGVDVVAVGDFFVKATHQHINILATNNSAGFTGVVAAAVIISKKDGENWARSNSDMVISEALDVNLYGTEAMNAAVESYQSASGANALNSAWYLNLANGQPFMGQLTLLNTTLEFEGEGGATIQRDVTIPIGKVVNENGVLQSLIPADASGNLIVKNNTTYGTMDDPSYGATEGAKVKVSDVYMQITGANRTYVWKESYAIQIQA